MPSQTSLDHRQKNILCLLVQHYVEDAAPVSSRRLAGELNLSSATIRNEMAELERLGYVFQPHTSAGRVPTEKAFSFYIREYVKEKSPSKKERQALTQAYQSGQSPIKDLSKCLSEISGEVVIVSFGLPDFFYTGLSYLFVKPEFVNYQVIVDFTSVIDHLDEILDDVLDKVEDTTQIMIGQSNPFGQNFSSIITRCARDGKYGFLALLGPMRMDYSDHLGLLQFSKNLIEEKADEELKNI